MSSFPQPHHCVTKRRVVSLAVFIILSALFSAAVVVPQFSRAAPLQSQGSQPAKNQLEYVPGEILVRFRDRKSADAELSGPSQLVLEQNGQQIQLTIERLGTRSEIVEGLRLARVAPVETLRAVALLNARPDVLYAEPNYIWHKTQTPNDPRFGEQSNLRSNSFPLADLDAEQAWDITTGSQTVAVGIIDEGIDISHPDLAANVWTNPGEVAGNGVDDDSNGFVDDVRGWDFLHNDASVYDGPGTNPDGSQIDEHGTHVAGVIGAVGNNGVGVAGINWNVTLVPLKFIGPNGGSTADVVEAYDYARNLKQAWQTSGGTRGANLRILNNSYGGRRNSQAASEAIRALSDAGILFIAAAGNDARDNDRFPVYPANFRSPNIVSVASAGTSGAFSSGFSNYGQRTVDMLAPGEQILSTVPGSLYDRFNGTSASAPHATGTAALVLAAFPGIQMNRLRSALVYGGSAGISQTTSSGKRVNARGALDNAAEVDNIAPAAVSNLLVTAVINHRRILSWTAPGDDGAGNGRVALYQVRYSDTDFNTQGAFDQGYRLLAPEPVNPGLVQNITVALPFRHHTGFIGVRAIDNVGNEGPISVLPVNAEIETADPFVVSQSAVEPLSTGGTPLNFIGDDRYTTYQLPFDFTFFGATSRGIVLSTNGAIHFTFPSLLPSGEPDIDFSGVEYLSARPMIAGLWDDLRTDRRPGDDIYVVIPDPTKIIFRWKAVTFDTRIDPTTTRGEHPVNFEIELRRDGTVVVRYGDGNHNLFPVVGASGGEPDSYLVDSHTSDFALKDLPLAPTVTFTPRRPTPLPNPDLSVAVRTSPEQAESGQFFTYIVTGTNNNITHSSEQTVMTNQLPPGVTFVSCSVSPSFNRSCTGPPVGSTGTVTGQIGTLFAFTQVEMVITVQVSAAAGSTLTNNASITGFWQDPVLANNSVSIQTEVREAARFANVIKVSGGGNFLVSGHTIALKSDGTVWAWGINNVGQLGDGTTFNSINVPSLVLGLSNVTDVDAGGNHSVALKSDSSIWGWGQNTFRQSGDVAQDSRPRAGRIEGLTGTFTAVSAGGAHSLALRSDGTVWGWGSNGGGELGNGTTAFSTYPAVQASGLTNVVSISAGYGFSLAVKGDGTLWGWGSNHDSVLALPSSTVFSNTPIQITSITDVRAVAGGGTHTLALKNDGTVWAWGENSQGQLGSGEGFGTFATPRRVVGLTNVVAVSAGNRHSLALKSDGTVWSWGNNVHGQLGNDSTNNSNVPILVSNLNATAITAGDIHSGALMGNGTIRMWGNNTSGALGDRTNISRMVPIETVASFGPPLPFVTPDGGTFNNRQGVTIFTNVPGVIIFYTIDGSDPTELSPAVSSGATLVIDHSVTLKTRSFKPGWPMSATKSSTFVINAPPPTPTPTPVAGAGDQPIAFTRFTDTGNEIFLMNVDGTNEVNITNNPAGDSQPSWAPNATRLAFTTTRTIDNLTHVALVQPDGANLQIIDHFNGANEGSPSWSVDGTKIAYTMTFPASGVTRIAVMDANNFGVLSVSNNFSSFLSPTWSPDGTKIAFQEGFGFQPADISVLPSATLFFAPTKLTTDPADDITPSWSPDGAKIAFASNRSGDYEIYVMNADGSNVQRLTNSAGADRSPSWSPDGSKILFSSERHGLSEIYVMDANGSNQTRLTNNAFVDATPVWRVREPSFVQFSAATYQSSEAAVGAQVTVTRTGDLSSAVTVDYATIDNPAQIRCDEVVANNGAAFARCDYASTIDMLTFGPGETSKTFTIPLVDDAHVESAETIQLSLLSAVGGNIGTQRTATLTITDNDTAGGANPIFNSPFFVRQHYLDFLSREPEPTGLAAWLNVLNNCSDVNNNPACDRLTVSASFFGSQEFRLKGFFVFKFYRLTLGRLPTYDEIVRDMRSVTGQTDEEVFAKRNAFTTAWVLRQDYRERLDLLNNSDFIDRLLRNVNIDHLSGAVTRETLLTDLIQSRKTRTEVVRALVEHPDVDAKEFNGAFVAMQYYGYLRRTPEPTGYQNWLNHLNTNPTDFRTMVNGFMNSVEYRLRFGP